MNIAEIIILALALSLDALIVSFSFGLILDYKRVKNSFVLAFAFGFFQFLMPLIGWFLTSFVYSMLFAFSKWIVFAIFMFLASKFLKSAFSKESSEKIHCISLWCILSFAVATSIDAMGAGISLRFVHSEIFKPSIIIGVITFINSFIGFWIACMCRKFPSKYIETTGAILLIYLALKAVIN